MIVVLIRAFLLPAERTEPEHSLQWGKLERVLSSSMDSSGSDELSLAHMLAGKKALV